MPDGKVFPNPVSKVAQRRYFYSSILDEHLKEWGDQPVENMLSMIEPLYAQSFRRFIKSVKDNTHPDVFDKQLLAKYLFLQFVRTEQARKNFDPIEIKGKTIDQASLQIYGISTSFREDNEMVQSLLGKKWEVLRCHTGLRLPTSDHPIVVKPEVGGLQRLIDQGPDGMIKWKETTFYFAINSEILLKIHGSTGENSGLKISKISAEEYYWYIGYLIANSGRQVFAIPGDPSVKVASRLSAVLYAKRDERNSQIEDLKKSIGL